MSNLENIKKACDQAVQNQTKDPFVSVQLTSVGVDRVYAEFKGETGYQFFQEIVSPQGILSMSMDRFTRIASMLGLKQGTHYTTVNIL